MRGQRETSKLPLRRENAGDQGMIGFSFVFWLVESWPITDRNKVNRPGGFIIYENNEETFLGKILGSEDASGCQKWAILQEKKNEKRNVWEFKNLSKIDHKRL